MPSLVPVESVIAILARQVREVLFSQGSFLTASRGEGGSCTEWREDLAGARRLPAGSSVPRRWFVISAAGLICLLGGREALRPGRVEPWAPARAEARLRGGGAASSPSAGTRPFDGHELVVRSSRSSCCPPARLGSAADRHLPLGAAGEGVAATLVPRLERSVAIHRPSERPALLRRRRSRQRTPAGSARHGQMGCEGALSREPSVTSPSAHIARSNRGSSAGCRRCCGPVARRNRSGNWRR